MEVSSLLVETRVLFPSLLQYGVKCLNRDHNCPYSHPLEEGKRVELAEAAGPNYKTKMCERYKNGVCSYGER